MKTFTVFRTVDFQTDIEAESKEEAYRKAEELTDDDWEHRMSDSILEIDEPTDDGEGEIEWDTRLGPGNFEPFPEGSDSPPPSLPLCDWVNCRKVSIGFAARDAMTVCELRENYYKIVALCEEHFLRAEINNRTAWRDERG